MSNGMMSAPPRTSVADGIVMVLGWLNDVPYTLLALPARFAVATVFWNSGTTKIASWDATLALFSDEYRLPLIPPEMGAYISATIELTTPVLLVLGFLTRPAAAVLLGMTTVIEVFVYPQAWPVHIQWAAMLIFLLFRGPGKFSLDFLIWRWFARGHGIPLNGTRG